MKRNKDFENFIQPRYHQTAGVLSDTFFRQSVTEDIKYSHEKNVIGYQISKKDDVKINFSVLGEDFSLPQDLSHILEEIEYSKNITRCFNPNWDEMGATPILSSLYISAIRFLVVYAKHIYGFGTIIDSPEINPTPNGAVDLSWRAKNARLLIKFKMIEDKVTAKFYGDHYISGTDKSGSVEIDSFDNSLLEWMKALKK